MSYIPTWGPSGRIEDGGPSKPLSQHLSETRADLADGSVAVAASGVLTADDDFGTGSKSRSIVQSVKERSRSIMEWKTGLGDAQDAFVAAMASGATDLYLPSGLSVTLEAAVTLLSGTRLKGRPGSVLTAAGTANINLLEITGSDILLEGLTMVGPLSCSPSLIFSNSKPGGACIAVNGGTRVKVHRCDISGHISWGMYFRNGTECEAIGNRIHSGILPSGGATRHNEVGGDIGILGAATDILVERNRCSGGLMIGICAQTSTVAGAATQDLVRIYNNRVHSQGGYGILVYNKDNTADIMRRIFIDKRNIVSGITGAIPFDDGGSGLYQYGMGIYAVGAESVYINNNDVRDVLASNVDETLGAAAICAADCKRSSIISNTVVGSAKHGISLRNPGRATYVMESGIVGLNDASGCVKAGFRIVRAQHFSLLGNSGCGNYNGLEVFGDPSVATQYGTIDGNVFNNNTNDGAYFDTSIVQYLTYNSNHTIGNGRYGVYWERGVTGICQGNTSVSNVSRQYNISSSVTFRSFSKNTGAGAADYVNNSKYPEGVGVNLALTGAITLDETSFRTMVWTSALSGHVTFTGPTVSSNNFPLGDDAKFTFVRSATATGAFNITFNGVSIAPGERMVHMVTASGTLTCIEKSSGVP